MPTGSTMAIDCYYFGGVQKIGRVGGKVENEGKDDFKCMKDCCKQTVGNSYGTYPVESVPALNSSAATSPCSTPIELKHLPAFF